MNLVGNSSWQLDDVFLQGEHQLKFANTNNFLVKIGAMLLV